MAGEARTVGSSLEAEVARLRRIEERMELILQVSGDLAAAAAQEDVARITVESGVVAVGASYGGLWLLEPHSRQLRLIAVSSLQQSTTAPWTTLPAELDAPLPQAVRTGEAIYLESLAAYQRRFPASFERTKHSIASADASMMLMPLAVKGRVLGALAITYDTANALDAADHTYLALLARSSALALERIQLYTAERSLRLEAEDATRAREEILSVVSHDLRNPLGTILIGASTLLQLTDDGDPKGKRIRTVAARITRQAERMARQIEDLVDFAGIQAGRLSIERSPQAPAAILATASDLFSPHAHERGLTFDVDVAAELPNVDCDPDRVIQLLSNLTGNAIKVTPRGGRITLGATTHPTEVVFFVRDTGPGIEAEELPRLFERYWRSKKATYKGAGLGLSIARGIVDAHGGRIWADSQIGVSTTFYFTLTPRPSEPA